LGRGVRPLKIDDATELTDPAIWITESIYIQVGEDYLVIFKSKPNGLAIYRSSLNINDIMAKLRQAIDEGKPGYN
jgi:hypothetical protein